MLQLSEAALLASLPPPTLERELSSLSIEVQAELLWTWHFWARPSQIQPPGDWQTWVACAGRGFGKTRLGSEWVREMVCGSTPLGKGKVHRIALIAETAADARDVMVEAADSGLLAVHPPAYRPLYEPSKRRLTWPNGAIATTYNATEPDQLRGPQHDLAWGDELAKWRYARETWDMLQFGLRVGEHPRALVTTTPRPIGLLKEILADPTTVVTRGRTMDNAANLARPFLKKITERYAGTRLGRQELDAEMLDDLPGALWIREQIDANRIGSSMPPAMQRIVVAVDPSGTHGKASDNADDVGIVVAGLGIDARFYVLADYSCNLSPSGWGRRAVDAYEAFVADRIIAEVNYGGAMVGHVIKGVNPNIPFREVTASRGKVARAEPIAALYEQGRVSHCGAFPALEDQLCAFTPRGYEGEGSPDRADACIWALAELSAKGAPAEPRVRSL